MNQEQKKAKRTFVQIFPREMMPPHYFEPVMHNGALKWAVLLGNEITIVPTNASELKKCMRFKMDKVRGLSLDEGDKVQFAQEDMTMHSGRVFVEYEEEAKVGKHIRRTSADLAAWGTNWMRGGSPRIQQATSEKDLGGEVSEGGGGGGEMTLKKESFHKFERHSAIFFYSYQMWLCRLVSDLYGWKRGKSADNGHHEEEVVRELYLDLHREIVAATHLQEKVDLLDELALAARFDVNLKKLILLQAPALLDWLCNELKSYDLLNYEKQSSSQEDAAKKRVEALQYVTVLLETLHKTLFGAWSVFAEKTQGPTLIARLIEPKGGLETLGNALGLMYVKSEELVEKDNTAYLEVVHMTVAVMYNTLLLYEQASMFEEGHQEQQKRKGMLATILCKAPFMERRVQHIMTGFKHVIQTQRKGPLRTVSLHQYAILLHYLSGGSKTANPISKALAANHTEDFHFIVPRFLHNEEHTHPLDRTAAEVLSKLLAVYCPELEVRL